MIHKVRITETTQLLNIFNDGKLHFFAKESELFFYLVKLEEIVRVVLDDEHVVPPGKLLKCRKNDK